MKFAVTMLDTVLPLTLVDGAIDPIHLTITMAFVPPISTHISIATLPVKLALTMLLVLKVVSGILIAIDLPVIFLPFPLALLHTIAELTGI